MKETFKKSECNEFLVNFKYWFFSNYWWLFVLSFIAISIFSIAILEKTGLLELVAGVYAILVSAFFFVQKQRIEEQRIFKELVSEFNNRYDELNDPLNHW